MVKDMNGWEIVDSEGLFCVEDGNSVARNRKNCTRLQSYIHTGASLGTPETSRSLPCCKSEVQLKTNISQCEIAQHKLYCLADPHPIVQSKGPGNLWLLSILGQLLQTERKRGDQGRLCIRDQNKLLPFLWAVLPFWEDSEI